MASKEITYDAGIIQGFAERLYKQADSIIITSTCLGIFVGAIAAAGAVIGLIITAGGTGSSSAGFMLIVMLVLFGGAGGLRGYFRGSERAFKLKLDAQVALCQVQIEKNTSGK